LPIIVVSARVENHERLEGIEAGAEVYIGKPFIVDELLLVVKNTLRQRDLLRRKFRGEVTDTLVVENISNEEMNFVESVNKLIDENLSSGDVNGSFLAEKCCMSVSTLNRRMRNLTGMPVAVYIRSRRMSIAKRMLVETDKPISEIEWMCGFNTVGHFSRQFHQEFGCTPTAYRQQMQK
ncbi:MAG: helix-turn-helix domain-containing protein, partial [Prevotellaceae bacterium]|nr:helix-turn-helix domain-containing protein [Prevotellaceae bacterium]